MKTVPAGIRCAKLIVMAILLATASGCNAVLSKRPVGETPAMIIAKDWEGEWVTTDGSVKLTVIDADKGLLKAYWLDDEKGKPMMQSADIELRESGEWMFASINEKDTRTDGDKRVSKGYLWARVKNKDRQIIIWTPDDKAFTRLVTSGVFPGKINDGGSVILDELKPQHLKIITSGERGVLFEWDQPTVLMKVGK